MGMETSHGALGSQVSWGLAKPLYTDCHHVENIEYTGDMPSMLWNRRKRQELGNSGFPVVVPCPFTLSNIHTDSEEFLSSPLLALIEGWPL